MSDIAKLSTQPRNATGSRAAAKLRKQGLVPAIVYGHGEPVAHVCVNGEELDRAIRVLHARTFRLDIGGKSDTVLIKELQFDYLGKSMIHVDFERKSLSERVQVSIPVELRNTPTKTDGAALDQPLHALRVECPLGSIPDAVRIDITGLTLGNPVHVRDLPATEGVAYLDAPEMVVVQLSTRAPEPEEVVSTEGAEPEVVGADKDDADAEGGDKKED